MPIKLTAASLGTDTRAADGINNTNFPFETPITVAVDGTNYGYKTDATSVSDPMVCQETASPYFPVNGSSVHIVAYHPASMQYATADQTFTVAADQSTAAGYIASDLMVGLPQMSFENGSGNSLIEGSGMTRKVKRTSIPIPLEFEHKLSKIKVNVTINGAVVKSVTMKNIMRSVDFNPSTAALSNVTPVATTGLDNVIMFSDFTGTSTNFVTAAIIPEQDPTTGTEFIDVVIQDSPSDKTLTYKLQEDGDFESGKQYVYNLTVSNDEILCTTSITNWDDVALTPAQQGDGLAFIPNYMKLPLWYMADYNMASATSMASTDNAGYFFSWSDAMSNFAASTTSYSTYTCAGKKINGDSYHLPVRAEWWGISPGHNSDNSSLWTYDNGSGTYKSNYITPVWGYNSTTKAGVAESSYWKRISSTEVHAIRFLGTEFCSAWKYIKTGNSMIICATLIDKVENSSSAASTWYANNFSSVTFGDNESIGAVQRTIYARGDRSGSGDAATNWANRYGYYWSATEVNSSDAYGLHINPYDAGGGTFVRDYTKSMGGSVRLFRDN